MRRGCLVLLVALTASGSLHAQTPAWKYQWQKDQVLTYRVEHVTTITDVVAGSKVETAAKTNLVKRWQVNDVDAQGVATLTLTLAALRNEQTRPNGEVLFFDSAQPEKSTPALKEALGKFVGQPLAVLRVDGYGNVVEVKKGDRAQYETDPPFTLVLPAAAPQQGQGWSRPVKLAIPGKAPVEAAQRFVCKAIANNTATLTVGTAPNAQPSAGDLVPVLQKLTEGEIVFDLATGRVRTITLNIDRTVPNHQGEGSSYRLVSNYREELVAQ